MTLGVCTATECPAHQAIALPPWQVGQQLPASGILHKVRPQTNKCASYPQELPLNHTFVARSVLLTPGPTSVSPTCRTKSADQSAHSAGPSQFRGDLGCRALARRKAQSAGSPWSCRK